MARARQHLCGSGRAGDGGNFRRVPGQTVRAHDTRRTAGGGPHRRRERDANLRVDRAAGAAPDPGHARSVHLSWQLERLFMWPLIVLTEQDLYTLPIALAQLSREHVPDNELMMAGAVLTVLPVLVLFLSLQRYYIRGILMGSVKG